MAVCAVVKNICFVFLYIHCCIIVAFMLYNKFLSQNLTYLERQEGCFCFITNHFIRTKGSSAVLSCGACCPAARLSVCPAFSNTVLSILQTYLT